MVCNKSNERTSHKALVNVLCQPPQDKNSKESKSLNKQVAYPVMLTNRLDKTKRVNWFQIK